MLRRFVWCFLVVSVGFGIWSDGSSQDGQERVSLKQLDWLDGAWKRESQRGLAFEVWKKVSDQTMEGVGFVVSGSDTAVSEYLRLEQFGDEIFYTARVGHNEFPVPFKLVQAEGKRFVFENSKHDFPQRVIYRLKENGALHARVEGSMDGKESGFDLVFVKED